MALTGGEDGSPDPFNEFHGGLRRRMLIHVDLLRKVFDATAGPVRIISPSSEQPAEPPDWELHPELLCGWFVNFDVVDRVAIYRLGRYRPESRSFEAAWPD